MFGNMLAGRSRPLDAARTPQQKLELRLVYEDGYRLQRRVPARRLTAI